MNGLSAFRFLASAVALLVAGSASADSTGKWQNSQEIYDKVCAHCHEHNVGPVITGRNLMPDYIKSVVRNGNRAMPAFRETEINEAALAGVIKLVSSSTAVARK